MISYVKDNRNLIKSLASILILMICPGNCLCQNLIPNPSFEDGSCPFQFVRKPDQFPVSLWQIPDMGTPDYYHRCASKEVTIPYNWAGAQEPVDGDAYLGIYLKKGRKYQENIGIALLDSLEAEKTYFGRFFVATVANSEFFPCEISIALTSTLLKISPLESFDHRQITLQIPGFDEFMNFSWQELTFSFTAKGGEKYLYLGSLSDQVPFCGSSKYRVKKEPMLDGAAYVFIDDLHLGTDPDFKEPTPTFKFIEEVDPSNVLFEFDRDVLISEMLFKLNSIANFTVSSDLHLLITGGTDSLGTDSYNRRLGLKRAVAVKEYLIFKGVSSQRIGVTSIGENNPTYPNHSENTRSLNRAALIEFYKEVTAE